MRNARSRVGVLRALVTLLAVASSWLPIQEARAADAVAIQTWDTGEVEEHLETAGASVTRSDVAAAASSMAGNPDLDGSAWAHTGAFWIVSLDSLPEVRIRVDAANASELAPGLSVWATGTSPFDGGTTGVGGETSSAGFQTPHSFNAFGPLGDPGTLWMQDGQGGNAKELLGYAIAGPSVLDPGGWGELIESGAHDQRVSAEHASSVSGSSGAGFAELVLHDTAVGWLLIYAGGTDHALTGGQFDLTVQVPEPGAVPAAVTVALVLLGLRGRRRRGC